MNVLYSVEGMTGNLRVLPVHGQVKPNSALIGQNERSERENERGAGQTCLSVY